MTVSSDPANGEGARLRSRGLHLYIAALGASAVGTAMVPAALSYTLLDLGRTVSDISLLLALQSLAFALLIIPAGAWADQSSRRGVMISADLLRFFTQGVLALMIFAGETSMPVLGALMLLLGIGNAFFQPASGGLITQIVERRDIGQATTAAGLSQALANAAGPAMAGALIAFSMAWLVFALDAATFLASGLLLLAVRPRPKSARGRADLIGDMAEGLREFARHRWLWSIVGLFCLLNLLAMPPLLVLGAAVFHARDYSALVFGAVMTSGGVGVIVGGLMAFRLKPRRPLVWSAALMLCGTPLLVLVAIDAPVLLIMLAGVGTGAGLAFSSLSIHIAVQQRVTGDRLSRVLSVTQLVALATAPVGFAIAGPAGEAFGSERCLLVAAVVLTTGCLCALASRDIRGFVSAPEEEPAL